MYCIPFKYTCSRDSLLLLLPRFCSFALFLIGADCQKKKKSSQCGLGVLQTLPRVRGFRKSFDGNASLTPLHFHRGQVPENLKNEKEAYFVQNQIVDWASFVFFDRWASFVTFSVHGVPEPRGQSFVDTFVTAAAQ